jgi:Subtilase family
MSARWDSGAAAGAPLGTASGAAVGAGSGGSSSRPRDIVCLDPYFRWAEHTAWRGMRSQAQWSSELGPNDGVQIIARAHNEAALQLALAEPRLLIPPAYHRVIPGTASTALHFTAWVRRADLPWLRCTELGLWWELSQPRRDAERLASATSLGRHGPASFAQSNTQDGTLGLAAPNVLADAVCQARHPPGLASKQGPNRRAAVALAASAPPLRQVMAVVDAGCPFLNPRYASPEAGHRTRIHALWDQGGGVPRHLAYGADTATAAGWPWSVPVVMGHGRHITHTVVQAMCDAVHRPGMTANECSASTRAKSRATATATAKDAAAGAYARASIRAAVEPEASIDESDAYRGIDHLVDADDPRRRIWLATHGAHVLDVAGGGLNPLTGAPDAASAAQLVFVQLPSLTAADSSGASLAGHVLDAVRYVLALCDDKARVVINISYGSHAGPHNGTALIESALDELLQARRDNFAIVLAAGNSRQQACHVERQVRWGRTALLRCAVAPADTTDTFIETWYPPAPAGFALQARVRGPQRVWSDWVAPGQEQVMRDSAEHDEVVALLRHDAEVPNGRHLGLVLLALAPTAQPVGVVCALAPAGLWEIELRLVAAPGSATSAAVPVGTDLHVTVNARIERDDPGQNAGAALHRFVDPDADDDRNTLSSLATGQHTVVVGGFRRSDGRATAYSALGPQRLGADANVDDKRLPMVWAACEEDDSLPTVAAAAVRTGEVFRMNGTSVAAPVLARQLYNVMAKGKTIRREQWAAVLRELCAGADGLVRGRPD